MYCHGENSDWMYKNCQRTCGFCNGRQQQQQQVVVDCQWSEWQYGLCSRECGSGERRIFRTERVRAQNGGRPCFGERTKTENCYNQDCPIDCQWSAWKKEGECSKSCNSGKQIFIRSQEIKAKNGGRPCSGSDSKFETCNNHNCFETGKYNQRQQQYCEDKHSDCAENKMYCHGKNSEWMYKNCQRTCGKCY